MKRPTIVILPEDAASLVPVWVDDGDGRVDPIGCKVHGENANCSKDSSGCLAFCGTVTIAGFVYAGCAESQS